MIAVDWGTSSLRAYRLGASGIVLEQRSSPAGIRACQGGFEAVLAEQLRGWDDELIVMAGMIGSRNFSAYAAAKGGGIALTKSMAKDFGKQGIRVNCIAPGPIDTPAIAGLTSTICSYVPRWPKGVDSNSRTGKRAASGWR